VGPAAHGSSLSGKLLPAEKGEPGMARRRSGLNLSAPKVITYVVAVALMAFGIIAYYTEIIDVSVDTAFLTLAAGAVLLAIANLLKDL
jgi:hypothetical protein